MISRKLIKREQHYTLVQIPQTDFHTNHKINKGRTDSKLFTPLRKVLFSLSRLSRKNQNSINFHENPPYRPLSTLPPQKKWCRNYGQNSMYALSKVRYTLHSAKCYHYLLMTHQAVRKCGKCRQKFIFARTKCTTVHWPIFTQLMLDGQILVRNSHTDLRQNPTKRLMADIWSRMDGRTDVVCKQGVSRAS